MGVSVSEYKEMLRKGKSNKYGAVKANRGKLTFDSKGEAERYDELLLLLKAGEITNLQLQKAYVLQEGYTTIEGERIQAITYKVDFYYRENGKEVVEDFKGKATRTYMDKVKLFKARYPWIEFREVK